MHWYQSAPLGHPPRAPSPESESAAVRPQGQPLRAHRQHLMISCPNLVWHMCPCQMKPAHLGHSLALCARVKGETPPTTTNAAQGTHCKGPRLSGFKDQHLTSCAQGVATLIKGWATHMQKVKGKKKPSSSSKCIHQGLSQGTPPRGHKPLATQQHNMHAGVP